MQRYTPASYGDSVAEVYDDWLASFPTLTDDTVEFLASLAGDEPLLELGIGTGRVALPLVRRGLEVHGVEVSDRMIAKLREKPDAELLHVTQGDFSRLAVEGRFSVVFVVFNTFENLLTQEDQLRCFQGVAALLAPGGTFVLDTFVPDPTVFDRGQRVEAAVVGDHEVFLTASRHDPLEQRIVSQQVVLSERGTSLFPIQLRYVWPSELELLGRAAGLRLRERWGSWRRDPFTAQSARHVSVFASG